MAAVQAPVESFPGAARTTLDNCDHADRSRGTFTAVFFVQCMEAIGCRIMTTIGLTI